MNLVDTSVWIDYFRLQTPRSVKVQINDLIQNPEVVICEPILFEMMRATSKTEAAKIEEFFATIPVLATPESLWLDARQLSQKCIVSGFLPRSMDVLIAQIAIHHDTLITTFDNHFQKISEVSSLRLNSLTRPRPDSRR